MSKNPTYKFNNNTLLLGMGGVPVKSEIIKSDYLLYTGLHLILQN